MAASLHAESCSARAPAARLATMFAITSGTGLSPATVWRCPSWGALVFRLVTVILVVVIVIIVIAVVRWAGGGAQEEESACCCPGMGVGGICMLFLFASLGPPCLALRARLSRPARQVENYSGV